MLYYIGVFSKFLSKLFIAKRGNMIVRPLKLVESPMHNLKFVNFSLAFYFYIFLFLFV